MGAVLCIVARRSNPTLLPTFIQPSAGAAISRENDDADMAMSAAMNSSYWLDFSEQPLP